MDGVDVSFLIGVVGLLEWEITSESSPKYELSYSLFIFPLFLLLPLASSVLFLLLEDSFRLSLLRYLLFDELPDDVLFDLDEPFLVIDPLLPDLVNDDDDFISLGTLGRGELTERALDLVSFAYYSLKELALRGHRGLLKLFGFSRSAHAAGPGCRTYPKMIPK